MKSQQMQDKDILKQILINSQQEGGVKDNMISKQFNISEQKKADLINMLLGQMLLRVEQLPNRELVYHYQDPDQFKKYSELSTDEQIILKIISNSQNKGCYIDILKRQSKFQPQRVQQILKQLQKHDLIKQVQLSNTKSKKKLWLLKNMEFDEEAMAGGLFKLDLNIVQVLYDKALSYIQQKEIAGHSEIVMNLKSYYNELNYETEEELKQSDISMILQLLLYDDKIENLSQADKLNLNAQYSLTKWIQSRPFPALTKIPCGICPFVNECQKTGKISPQNCPYFEEW